MSAELSQAAAPGAPALRWKPYPVYSGMKWMGKLQAQDRKALVIFQTGLTGLTGYVLSFNPVHPVILSRIKKPQMNADERRFVAITHRKGRKAQQQKSLRPLRSLRLIGINGIAAQEAAR